MLNIYSFNIILRILMCGVGYVTSNHQVEMCCPNRGRGQRDGPGHKASKAGVVSTPGRMDVPVGTHHVF